VTQREARENWFLFHPATSTEVVRSHEEVRASFRETHAVLERLLPDGPDKTVAVRALQAAMWAASSCIACNS
jgi:hypothetical protein